MKGDLHVHSRHSNDSTNNPVAKIVALAETVGMDYLLISDHDNHVDGDVASHTWADPEFRSDSVLLLYGAEWTTQRGHGTAMSARPYDHKRFYDVRDARDAKVIATKKALGIFVAANHPMAADHFGFSYDLVDSMEVWSSAIWSSNTTALTVWDDMLKSGRRIAANGGSDSHHGYPDSPDAELDPNNVQAGGNNVGTPTTWVYGSSHNSEAVFAALKAGRSSVSANPFSPRVEFTADLDGDDTPDGMMGDNLAGRGLPVRFRVLLGNANLPLPYQVKVIKDGAELGTYTASGFPPVASFTDTPAAGSRSYYRVEVTGTITPYPQVPASALLSGNMVGLSSPIYFNFDPSF
nr:CehA/McbA family metallohydrolase [Stenotrophobium rhamnosiphilum]